MKKIVFGLALGAVMAGFGIESQTVGYQQYSLDTENPDDYVHNVGVQFQNVSGEPFAISNEFFGVTLSDGDQFFIFDPVYYGYTLYTYGDIGGKMGFSVMYADGSDGDSIESLSVDKGDNILYMPVDATTKPVVSGNVEESGTVELSFTVTGDDYIFPITNPFPQATKMKDLTFLQDGDQIFVWDSVYYGYTLLTYGDVGGGTMGFTVMNADGSDGDPISDPEYVIFDVGQGGLVMPTETRTWTITLNY